ncbi:hypothetical protein IE81DRAFT_347637 [Ceraceosorus guamensis]|uniref:LsmAD domain-containing protein n=1 Tax=Ceraceosorus guamensis TaxID=1522189 RepID=A0A316VX78_9BASI|nr:hypothetical protein IE81DRAFT_347637 [Ceraceosorus guamensis]PWN42226.1 hypothetical protein IE81DRAFT_347637 [Ceraceosorus guamensis]
MASNARGGRGGGPGASQRLSATPTGNWRTGGPNGAASGASPAGGAGSRWAAGPPRNNQSAQNGNASGSSTPGVAGPAASKGANPAIASPSSTHAIPTTSFPSLAASAQAAQAKPPNAAAKDMRERLTFLLVSLIGTPVVATTHGGFKFIGILSATSPDSDELGVALSAAQEVLPGGEYGPLRKMLVINGSDLDEVHASDVRLGEVQSEPNRKRDGFRTDTEISKLGDPFGGGRELQKWSDDPELAPIEAPGGLSAASGALDSASRGGEWDQFKANEARFGLKSDYAEDLYTTRLDRSGKDFAQREREADRLAREIMGQASTNAHIAEERGQHENANITEEDRYGAVVRNPNAYVPPALRRAGAATTGTASPKANGVPQPAAAAAAPAAALPSQSASAAAALPIAVPSSNSVHVSSGPPAESTSTGTLDASTAAPVLQTQAPTPVLGTTPETASVDPAAKKDAESRHILGDFREFVNKERERLEKKRAALAKKEKDDRLAELKQWGGSFKLKTPVPADVAKSPSGSKGVTTSLSPSGAAASEKPRDPTLLKSLSPTTVAGEAVRSADRSEGTASVATSPKVAPRFAATASNVSAGAASRESQPISKGLAGMTIPKIPPFNPNGAAKRKSPALASSSTSATISGGTTPFNDGGPASGAPGGASGLTASTSVFKMSAKANSFKPFNPNATAFTPGTTAKKDVSTLGASTPAKPTNPFFGNRVIKKPTAPSSLHVREDFNPFKVSKVPEASAVGPLWTFTGKPYRQLFAAVLPPGGPQAGPSGQVSGVGFSTEEGSAGSAAPAHVAQGAPQQHFAHVPVGAQGQAMQSFGQSQAGASSMPQPHPTGPGGPANNVAAPGTPGAQHVQPGQPAHPPQAGLPPHSQGGPPHHGQPFAPIMYAAQPYGAYRFQGQPQQQQMMPQMQMQPGAPMPYGAMPPHFAMQGMPFSPPLPPHGAPSGLYSPQMGHQMPHGPHGNQFMGGAGGHSGGPPPPPYVGGLPSGGPPPRPGHMPPHMQGKGPPGHFYQGQPMQGMTYGAPFPPGAQPFPPGGGPQASTGNGNVSGSNAGQQPSSSAAQTPSSGSAQG